LLVEMLLTLRDPLLMTRSDTPVLLVDVFTMLSPCQATVNKMAKSGAMRLEICACKKRAALRRL